MYGLLASHLRWRGNWKHYNFILNNKPVHFRTWEIYTVSYKDLRCHRNSPVVIRVIPVIKMNQKTVGHFVCYCGNTDERGIHAVDSLQLHPHLKPTVCLRLYNEKTRSLFRQNPFVRNCKTDSVCGFMTYFDWARKQLFRCRLWSGDF